jgi:hypothetical protein
MTYSNGCRLASYDLNINLIGISQQTTERTEKRIFLSFHPHSFSVHDTETCRRAGGIAPLVPTSALDGVEYFNIIPRPLFFFFSWVRTPVRTKYDDAMAPQSVWN